MAVTMSLYDHTVFLLTSKAVTFTTIKVKLLDNTAAFTQGNTTVAAVDGSVTQVTTNDAQLSADNVTQTATGGSIGPAYAALVYDSTSNKPLVYIDFGQAQSAGATTDFKIVWDATNGIIKFSY
jgi:hypothetical protein